MTARPIAICISGQIRTSLSALSRLAEEAELSGADVFVSVWSEIGQKTFEGAVGPKNIRRIIGSNAARHLPENWLGRMKDIFPDFMEYFPHNPQVSRQDIEAIFPHAQVDVEVDGPEFDLAESDSNSLRMLRRIWRANEMKRAAEAARGYPYEKVLRVRPDMLFDGRALKNITLAPDAILLQGHANNRPDYVNDTIWLTSSQNDDALCALYKKCTQAPSLGWLGIHRELSEIVTTGGMKPGIIRMIKAGVGNLEAENHELQAQIAEKLFAAIAEQKMAPAPAGGAEFCALVSDVIKAATPEITLPPQIDEQLENIKQKRRNSYFHALLYAMSIVVLDQKTPTQDRLALLFRVLHYYTAKNVLGHLEVRIGELPEIFIQHPAALHAAVFSETISRHIPQNASAASLAQRFDDYWASMEKADNAVLDKHLTHRILSAPKFVIELHRALSKAGNHEQAFALAAAWVKNAPAVWRAYDLYAESALALGEDARAESIFREAEEKTAPHPRLLELKGNFFARKGRLDDALQAYQRALSLPGGNKSRINRALDHIKQRAKAIKNSPDV